MYICTYVHIQLLVVWSCITMTCNSNVSPIKVCHHISSLTRGPATPGKPALPGSPFSPSAPSCPTSPPAPVSPRSPLFP